MTTISIYSWGLRWRLREQLRTRLARYRVAGRHRTGHSVGATLRVAALRPVRATLAAWHSTAPVLTPAAAVRTV